MQRNADRLKAYKLSPRQVQFLQDFGEAWRAGTIALDAAEINQLLDLGYVIRNPGLCANEVASLEAAVDRSRRAQERLEAEGKHQQAAQCAAKIRKLRQRIEMKALMITPTGKAVARDLPGDLVRYPRLSRAISVL